MAKGASPGPAPAAQARASNSRLTRSSWRTWPHLKLRRKVPRMDGTLTVPPRARAVPGAGRPLHGSVGSQPPQPCYPGLLPEAAGSWQAEKGGAGRVHAQTAGYTQRHSQTWLPLVRYDSASRRSFLLTFKTVAIGCSLFPGGFLFQNHYSRFRGASSGCFKGCPKGRPSVDSG